MGEAYITRRGGAQQDWVGELTFSGSYANDAQFITQAGCSLAVDPIRGMAFLVLQNGTSTTYENIYFQTGSSNQYMSLPEGVTFLPTQKYGGPTGGSQSVYFVAAFTGIKGKINVDVEPRCTTPNSDYDYAIPRITMTYA